MEAAAIWLVLLAFLVHPWLAGQNWHSGQASSGGRAAAGLVRAAAVQAGAPCAMHGHGPQSQERKGPPPRHGDDCPFCPCPCCGPAQIIGILPQGAGVLPIRLGSDSSIPGIPLGSFGQRFCSGGQPRAPPVLI